VHEVKDPNNWSSLKVSVFIIFHILTILSVVSCRYLILRVEYKLQIWKIKCKENTSWCFTSCLGQFYRNFTNTWEFLPFQLFNNNSNLDDSRICY
jgi:hypothetical protein